MLALPIRKAWLVGLMVFSGLCASASGATLAVLPAPSEERSPLGALGGPRRELSFSAELAVQLGAAAVDLVEAQRVIAAWRGRGASDDALDASALLRSLGCDALAELSEPRLRVHDSGALRLVELTLSARLWLRDGSGEQITSLGACSFEGGEDLPERAMGLRRQLSRELAARIEIALTPPVVTMVEGHRVTLATGAVKLLEPGMLLALDRLASGGARAPTGLLLEVRERDGALAVARTVAGQGSAAPARGDRAVSPSAGGATPGFVLIAPQPGAFVTERLVTVRVRPLGSQPGQVLINGIEAHPMGDGSYAIAIGAREGANRVHLEARRGRSARGRAVFSFQRDTTPPSVRLLSPRVDARLSTRAVEVWLGSESPDLTSITVDGRVAERVAKARYRAVVTPRHGLNRVSIVAVDARGNRRVIEGRFYHDRRAPKIEARATVVVEGRVGVGDRVFVDGREAAVLAGRYQVEVELGVARVVSIEVVDRFGNKRRLLRRY